RPQAEKAPPEGEKQPARPGADEEARRADRLNRARAEQREAEQEYLALEQDWATRAAQARLRVAEAEERGRALERAQAAEREREEAGLRAAEAARDKEPDSDALRRRVAELEALAGQRELQGGRVEQVVQARRDLVTAEEALRRAEREQEVRRARALARLERAD